MRLTLSTLAAAALLSACSPSAQQNTADTAPAAVKTVAITQIVEHPALDASVKGFADGLAQRGYKDGDKIVLDKQNAQGDQSNMETIVNRFIADKDKLIYAVATSTAQVAANKTKDIPIVGAAIYDYQKAGLVKSLEKPGANVTGTTNFNPVEKQLDLILKVLPGTKEVGVIYASSEVNSQAQIEMFKAYAAKKNIKIVEGTISNVNDIQQVATNMIQQGVKVIFVPTDNLVASSMANLTAITDKAKVPVFVADDNLLKSGGLMGYTVDYYKLGVQAGQMAADILDGKSKPEDMAIQSQPTMKLAVNKDALQRLGITLPADLPQEAK